MANYASSFARLRRMAGDPVLTCVKPRAQWTSVPSGYTFDESCDGYMSGVTPWVPTSTADLNATDYVTVPFLPMDGREEILLVFGGSVDQGEKFGRVLPANIATVKAAQWLEIDGLTYDLREKATMPAGVGMWYAIRMGKR